MKTLTMLSIALVMAFAYSTPVVFMTTSAHATHVGDGFRREFDSWGNSIENWWESTGLLIEDLDLIEELE
ncbi:MAG: hypothetical protein V6Z81_03875 [Parvularculales bacterium]